MNFDLTDEQRQFQDSVRNFLERKVTRQGIREVVDGAARFDERLWREMAEFGLMGVGLPEVHGGAGSDTFLELCVVSEEIGRALAPVPFASSCLAAAAIALAGGEAQKARHLPDLASGLSIGTLVPPAGAARAGRGNLGCLAARGRLNGTLNAVADAEVADLAVVGAWDDDSGGPALYVIDLEAEGVSRARVTTLDPARRHATLTLHDAPAERLEGCGAAADVEALVDRAAVLTAFEQLGGAERGLWMARDHALQRRAFGRPIGSMQAVKHLLADMFVATELARSNSYYGAWAVASGAPEGGLAAASARLSATEAFQLCARNNIQIHGGVGFTWEADCHLLYRRSQLLALTLGGPSHWEERLVGQLAAQLIVERGHAS